MFNESVFIANFVVLRNDKNLKSSIVSHNDVLFYWLFKGG